MANKIIYNPSFEIEDSLRNEFSIICGLDEAGRGPLAGPVFAAAAVLPKDMLGLALINDSKKLNEKKREEAYSLIIENAVDYAISFVDNEEIDKINILNSSIKAMNQACANLKMRPDYLLIDGNRFKTESGIPFQTVIKGDAKSYSIGAASILAKVARDRWIYDIADKEFPEYEFARHKGYPTKKHYELIEKHGICKYHRKSFLKSILNKEINLFNY